MERAGRSCRCNVVAAADNNMASLTAGQQTDVAKPYFCSAAAMVGDVHFGGHGMSDPNVLCTVIHGFLDCWPAPGRV